MGLVNYSDSSDSESEAPPRKLPVAASSAAACAGSSTTRKPFQKIVDRANPGKILVSLPQPPPTGASEDKSAGDGEPPQKRARIGGGSGGRFSGFGSFLPPPKKTGKPGASSTGSIGRAAPRPGVHLKTGAEPAFNRDAPDSSASFGGGGSNDDGDDNGLGSGTTNGSGLRLPPPKNHATPAQPFIPAEQKPAGEVKLVGKPNMFRPLSVARKPGKKSTATGAAATKVPNVQKPPGATASPGAAAEPLEEKKKEKKKKVSLFSIPDDAYRSTEGPTEPTNDAYVPLFPSYDDGVANEDQGEEDEGADDMDASFISEPSFAARHSSFAQPAAAFRHEATSQSLDTIADELNLSKAARREMFGRGGVGGTGGPTAATRVVNFNMDREYAHNEALRAGGEAQQQAFNPVRAIQPGKHSLRQLVNAVQSQREALEDSFAKNKSNRQEAAGRYGWK